ncbi:MAG TPA: Gfo/Idh/MocA family oxidoreductase [Steroidobacteraceae bacterium]|nr:Gfo/Idh/MocA family oxidoreductase [Steroidobacteraceae bacterium]
MKTQSRRSFLLQSAALAAAPFISTSVTRALARDSQRKLGVAICGLGSLSTNQIAPALLKAERCRLAGIVTDSPEKAGKWQTEYDIPDRSVYTYDTMEKMAHNRDIDIVYIVTPNALHAEQTMRAAKAGKHVFCEKPMEISVERCQQMIDACKAADRMLGVAYRCQFEPHHLECMRLAREKVFGAVRIVEAAFGVSITNPNEWRLKRALSGGGALMDVGIYALQAARYLTGEEPVLVAGTEAKTDPVRYGEVDESVVWTSRFPSGAIAHCGTSYNTATVSNFRVSAENGWFGLDPAFFYSGNRGRRSDGQEIRFPEIDQFAAELDDFARCIEEKTPSRVRGEEGLRDVRILMAIYESIRTGTAVKLA